MVINLRDVVVKRGHNAVLNHITCGIPNGHVIGLIGPSGSGKTTLLRTIMGVQKIASGSVTVLDCAAGTPLLRRHIGYMAQGSSVYDNLTVAENVQYFRRLLALCPSEVDRVLNLVELTEQKHQLVASLSGGQKARVSLAVALLGTPPLLVLDEPTVGLDPLLRDKLWRLFSDLAGAGTSLIISSHVMDEAKRCDHLLLLRDGQLIAQGSVTTLQQQTNAKDLEAAFIALATRQEASHD